MWASLDCRLAFKTLICAETVSPRLFICVVMFVSNELIFPVRTAISDFTSDFVAIISD
jgi:hypothetical protein